MATKVSFFFLFKNYILLFHLIIEKIGDWRDVNLPMAIQVINGTFHEWQLTLLSIKPNAMMYSLIFMIQPSIFDIESFNWSKNILSS